MTKTKHRHKETRKVTMESQSVKKYKKPRSKGTSSFLHMRFVKPLLGVIFSVLFSIIGYLVLTNIRAATPPPQNAANRIIFWIPLTDCIYMSDAELDKWRSYGVGGFVCRDRQLYGAGGSQKYSADSSHSLTGTEYSYQRELKSKRFAERSHARGMKVYMGFMSANYHNPVTPYREWYDDAGWNNTILPAIRNFTGAAKNLGFDGVNIDQETYPGKDSKQAKWTNTGTVPEGTTDTQVRAKVKQRGAEVMAQMVSVFPDLEIMTYFNIIPSGWNAYVVEDLGRGNNGPLGAYFMDFWDGMTSVEGYSAIRHQDEMFYKGINYAKDVANYYDTPLQYNANRAYAYLSGRWSNWDHAADKFSTSPFIWIDEDCKLEGKYAQARQPSYVSAQLSAYRKWAIDGQFSNYAYYSIRDGQFDYAKDPVYSGAPNQQCPATFSQTGGTGYVPGLQAAAKAGTVDDAAPELAITSPNAGNTTSSTTDLAGTTKDNLAVRHVKWTNDHGGSGTAQMTYQAPGGTPANGYAGWYLDWKAEDIPLQSGTNRITVTATDIKGLSTSKTIDVTTGSSAPPPPQQLGCSVSPSSVVTGQNATFSATGGNNTFSWSSPSGSPNGGSGTNFSTSFNTPGTNGATVTSGSQTATCTVTVTSPPPPPVATSPDLVVTAVAWQPASPVDGNDLTFRATVKNQGSAATPSTIHDVAFYVDDVMVAWSDNITTSIAAGQSLVLTANGGPDGNSTWRSVTGQRAVKAFVNSCPTGCGANRVTNESNRNNNTLTAQLVVAAAPSPPPAATPTPTPPPSTTAGKTGDVNNDNNIDIFDLSIVLGRWQQRASVGKADINNDGVVNIFDLSLLLSRWKS